MWEFRCSERGGVAFIDENSGDSAFGRVFRGTVIRVDTFPPQL
jgi:hypothetical protein